MNTKTAPLPAEKLYTACDPDQFSFDSTADLEPLDRAVGQDRAVEAVRFAVGMRHKGFNLFVLGEEGTGKYSLVRRFLEDRAAAEPVPDDWCYVNNFDEPHKPRAMRLPPGKARPLKEEMDKLVDELGGAIPAAFESEEFQNRKNAIEEQLKERQEEAFKDVQKRAEERDITLMRTPMGLALAPVKDGEVLNPQEFEELPEEEKKQRQADLEELQQELEKTLQEMPKWEKDQRQQMKELIQEVTAYAVDHLIDEMKKRWQEYDVVVEHLERVRQDVIENAHDFLPQTQQEGGGKQVHLQAQQSPFGREQLSGTEPVRRYQVNVVVDNTILLDAENGPVGAPVADEDHPTQPNLIGRIEHQSQFGTLMTDFNLIKGGALHRANGGYLILDVRKLLMQPYAWETLKRALETRRIRIESMYESLGFASTTTLDPEPIPLEIKVVLLGEPILYYLLNHYDPDFGELFKVAADFDNRMDRTDDAALHYARLLSAVARREELLPLDRTGVARVVEHGARLADDSEKLSTHMGSIVDLVREADFWAREAGADTVLAEHVQKAIDAKVYRSDRIRERIQEEIGRGTLVIDSAGEKVGQVNGLAVLMLDSFMFGKPSRISCRVRLGKGEVMDIEREVAMGGPLHSKGVMILSSYLSTRYARETPLSLAASLVFEQSYGGVDGDSASSTELYALLSAISGIPIKQSFAVTGSVDQNGFVQAIGGVNEKIEGFFDVCNNRGLTGDQGVLIPAANVKHLMLRGDVVEAVKDGRFHVYAVEHVDQGIEILTGVPAGAADDKGEYPIGTVNRAVAAGLQRLTDKARAAAAEMSGRGRGNGQEGRGQ